MPPRDEAAADYVIVGGGSAGATLAARLSEDPLTRVTLIEAGPARESLMVRMPAGVFKLIGNPAYDWNRPGEPDPTIGGRSLHFPAGKILGGSSAINGLVYQRGSRQDFARWEAAGAVGWGYDDVLPYYLKSEGFRGPPSQQHGMHGPMGVTPADLHPVSRRFLAGAEAIGLERQEDYCNGRLMGSFPMHGTIADGRRTSSYNSYLKPAMRRPNLQVIADATADRLEFDGQRVTGVRYRRQGDSGSQIASARREVIVCAGAFGSPLLLQRSGIGPAEVLEAAGVAPRVEAPDVGRHLQDHLGNGIMRFIDAPSYNVLANPFNAAVAGLQWLLLGKGPLASPSVHAMAYGQTTGDEGPSGAGEADFMLSFMPLCTDFSTGRPELHRRNGVFIATNVCRPKARGSVTIRSALADDPARIDMPLLAEEEDVETLIGSLKVIERILHAGFGDVLSKDQDEPIPSDEAGWRDWVRDRTSLGYHSVGTCRMGGEGSVVDAELRVRGVEGLRVADASVIPTIISGNTNAAVIMIAEKLTDLIRSR